MGTVLLAGAKLVASDPPRSLLMGVAVVHGHLLLLNQQGSGTRGHITAQQQQARSGWAGGAPPSPSMYAGQCVRALFNLHKVGGYFALLSTINNASILFDT